MSLIYKGKYMKINPGNVFPKNKTLWFAINNEQYVGVVFFEDGKWYSMPHKKLVEHTNFYWIDISE
jgi:hypothetical protein